MYGAVSFRLESNGSFLNIIDGNAPRFMRLTERFMNNMTEVNLFFFSHVLQYFVRLNLFLQRKEPIIGSVHEQVSYSCTMSNR